MIQAAIQLLPHLIEAMDRACVVGVVDKSRAVRVLKRTGGSELTFVIRVSGVLDVSPVPPEIKY